MALQIQEGRYYRRRDGETVGPIILLCNPNNKLEPFNIKDTKIYYNRDGYYNNGNYNAYDLVEEVPAPGTDSSGTNRARNGTITCPNCGKVWALYEEGNQLICFCGKTYSVKTGKIYPESANPVMAVSTQAKSSVKDRTMQLLEDKDTREQYEMSKEKKDEQDTRQEMERDILNDLGVCIKSSSCGIEIPFALEDQGRYPTSATFSTPYLWKNTKNRRRRSGLLLHYTVTMKHMA